MARRIDAASPPSLPTTSETPTRATAAKAVSEARICPGGRHAPVGVACPRGSTSRRRDSAWRTMINAGTPWSPKNTMAAPPPISTNIPIIPASTAIGAAADPSPRPTTSSGKGAK